MAGELSDEQIEEMYNASGFSNRWRHSLNEFARRVIAAERKRLAERLREEAASPANQYGEYVGLEQAARIVEGEK